MSSRIFTIGHSNRSFEDFCSLLKEFEIAVLVDIRRFPSSRKFPHFNQGALQNLLDAQGIQYTWVEALGGLRHKTINEKSPNRGLRAPAFRNYAGHMGTDVFKSAVKRLLSMARSQSTTVMCAERFYWKCHRRLLSDFLAAQGVEVEHIIESENLRPHKLTSGAVVTDDRTVIYPESRAEAQKSAHPVFP